jgi:hypothetical protein
MTTTLIATLGQSPGAVTGLYLELAEYQQPKQPIDRVYLLGTQDNDVLSAARVVKERLISYRKDVEIIEEHLDERDFRKVETFQKIVTHRLQDGTAQGDVIVGITGGRTGMGAMLAISAQFYERLRVCHYWVDDEIAQNGTISQLGKLKRINPELYELVLNPRRQENRSHIVELPATNMAKKRLEIESYRTSELLNNSKFDAKEANAILRLLPRRMTIDQAIRYTEVLIKIQDGAKPSTQFEDLISVLTDAGVTGIRGPLHNLLNLEDARPDRLQRWVNEVAQSREYWAEGLNETYEKFQSDPQMRLLRIGTSAAVVSAVGTFMQALILLAQHLHL